MTFYEHNRYLSMKVMHTCVDKLSGFMIIKSFKLFRKFLEWFTIPKRKATTDIYPKYANLWR